MEWRLLRRHQIHSRLDGFEYLLNRLTLSVDQIRTQAMSSFKSASHQKTELDPENNDVQTTHAGNTSPNTRTCVNLLMVGTCFSDLPLEYATHACRHFLRTKKSLPTPG